MKPPTLILYVEADFSGAVRAAREFYVALREREVPTQLVLYPHEMHAIVESDCERDRRVRSIT